MVAIHNFCAEPREVTFSISGDECSCDLINLLSHDHSQPDAKGRHTLLLEPYGYRWYRVCALDYLLKRSSV